MPVKHGKQIQQIQEGLTILGKIASPKPTKTWGSLFRQCQSLFNVVIRQQRWRRLVSVVYTLRNDCYVIVLERTAELLEALKTDRNQ